MDFLIGLLQLIINNTVIRPPQGLMQSSVTSADARPSYPSSLDRSFYAGTRGICESISATYSAPLQPSAGPYVNAWT